MNGLLESLSTKEGEEEFSFKKYFVPLTTAKAITWIVFIGLIVYFNALFSGFVWDDITYITTNSQLYNFNISYLFGTNLFNEGAYYRPIPAVYFSLLWNLFGNNAFFYHFSQILLHIVSTCLVFYFLKKFFNDTLSFCTSLIFLVHPIQVESVAYVGATQSELLFISGMCALIISYKDKLRWKSLLTLSIFLLLSILTKETGFLFLIMIILVQCFFKNQRLQIFLPYFISTIVVYLLLRFSYAKVFFQQTPITPIEKLSLLDRITNVPSILFYYLKTFFYPSSLHIDQMWIISSLDFQQFFFPLTIDIGFFILLGLGGVYIYKQNKKPRNCPLINPQPPTTKVG